MQEPKQIAHLQFYLLNNNFVLWLSYKLCSEIAHKVVYLPYSIKKMHHSKGRRRNVEVGGRKHNISAETSITAGDRDRGNFQW